MQINMVVLHADVQEVAQILVVYVNAFLNFHVVMEKTA